MSGLEESTYFTDADNRVEMARLIRQGGLMNRTVGLLPEGVDPSKFRRALDIGCATGGWVLDLVQQWPQIWGVGIDISPLMIRYAKMYAQAESVDGVEFREMDVRGPLDFADGSFDLVHSRLSRTFLLRDLWPAFLGECRRVLAPGGVVCLVEYEASYSTSLEHEKLAELFLVAMRQAKKTFSLSGRSSGVAPGLRRLLMDAGFERIGCTAHILDSSYGAENSADWIEDLSLFYQSFRPFLLQYAGLSEEELDNLYRKAREDAQQEGFCSMSYMLKIWGFKPL